MNEPKTAEQYALKAMGTELGRIDLLQDVFRQAMLQVWVEACNKAAIRAGAIGPCSGTRDWNESRSKASKDAMDMILALRDSKKLEDF